MKDENIPKRKRRKLRQRQEMLQAACDLFSRRCYRDVSMRQIAERAEFAVGTIYKFFQSKEDLYRSLMLEECDKFEDAIAQAIQESEDEIGKLRHCIRIKYESFNNNLLLLRLFLSESRGMSLEVKAGLDEEIQKRHYAFIERLASIFEGAIEKKRFKQISDPFSLAVALDGILDAFLYLRLNMPGHHSCPAFPNAILDAFFNGLEDCESCENLTGKRDHERCYGGTDANE